MENQSVHKEQEKHFCSYCGEPLLAQSLFCHKCGRDLTGSANNSDQTTDVSRNSTVATLKEPDNTSRSKKVRVLSIVGIVVALLSTIAFVIAVTQRFVFDPDKASSYTAESISHDISCTRVWIISLIVGCALLIIAVLFLVISLIKEKMNMFNISTGVLCIVSAILLILSFSQLNKRQEHLRIAKDMNDEIEYYEKKSERRFQRQSASATGAATNDGNQGLTEEDRRIQEHNDAIRDVTAMIDKEL